MKKRLGFIFGTRPEIIKMAPVIREAQQRGLDTLLIHTGQHYSFNMDAVFMRELAVPEPDYHLDVGSGTHGKQTGKLMESIEAVLLQNPVDIVFVQGDTNTVLAGALVAAKLHIAVGHVESGLRSYDRRMPEEINRIVADHVASYLFVPTEQTKQIALGEGICEDTIYMTGNTVVDSVNYIRDISNKQSSILEALQLEKGLYFLFTSHRPENVDKLSTLTSIIMSLERISLLYKKKIVWPIHPRTLKQLEVFSLLSQVRAITYLSVIEPLGFIDFLAMQANAQLIITDSGGIQEESCILRVPCVTLRDTTERPESVEVGANTLVGTEMTRILSGVRRMLSVAIDWDNPYGDGRAAERIIDAVI